MEAFTKKIDSCQNDPTTSYTRAVEKHEPSGYCLVAVETGKDDLAHYSLVQGADCMEKLVEELRSLAVEINENKRRYMNYTGPLQVASSHETCWVCEKPIENEQPRLDHCHYSGEFLGWTHNVCNVNRKSPIFTPVIAHNLTGYDLHLLLTHLRKHPSDKVSVIPQTDEKYVSMTLGVHVKDIVNAEGIKREIYEHLRFIDSCRFMMSSLDSLVQNLPIDKFQYLNKHFMSYGEDNIKLLRKKGHYPYSYMDGPARFEETELPPRDKWKDALKGGLISVTPEEYQIAQRVFGNFNCRHLGDYHDIYLQCDTILLACVFEAFRKVGKETYGLDPAYYLSASHMAGSALLKITDEKIELMTDREHLDMAEAMLRGGMASVYAKRHFKANNPEVGDDYDASKPSTYGLMADFNNLYGGVMGTEYFPVGNFQTVVKTLNEILSTPDDGDTGYIVEADLEYPVHLHDLHADFPLAPHHDCVHQSWLSDFQISVLTTGGLTGPSKVKKLLQTFHKRSKYIMHFKILKLYVELGLEVSAIHRVLSFDQKKWMAPYIELNSRKRQEATNKFEEDFYKLMNNAAFGKCCESKRKRKNVKLVADEEEAMTLAGRVEFNSFTRINQHLAAVSLTKRSVLWNTPTIIGASILDLAKLPVFKFHYYVMKHQAPGSVLLYSDTDSLMYEIPTDDLTELLKRLECYFDFSNYPKEHFLYDRTNHRVVLKLKDEFAGSTIREFVGLQPKMYSIIGTGGVRKQSAKGITKHAQQELLHERYVKVLQTGETTASLMYKIQSEKHIVTTVEVKKIALTNFQDKRYMLNAVDTLPYGHHATVSNSQSTHSSDTSFMLAQPLSYPSPARLQEDYSSGGMPGTPDPGFHQPVTRDSDYDNDLATSEDESEGWSPYNPFIIYEAGEEQPGNVYFFMLSSV